jgi:cytochrome c5
MTCSSHYLQRFVAKLFGWLLVSTASIFSSFAYSPGDLVRASKKDTLNFFGEPLLGVPKGQEFTVLKHQQGSGVVYLAFVQKEGAVVAVTLPEDSLEAVPLDAWMLTLRGAQFFRDHRFDDSKKLLMEAAKDASYRRLAQRMIASIDAVGSALRPAMQALGEFQSSGGGEAARGKLTNAQQSFASSALKVREVTAELDGLGYTSLSYAMDEGLDRLALKALPTAANPGHVSLPPSKLEKESLAARASKAAFSVVRCRQAIAVRRLMEASHYISEGLVAEPARPELKAMQVKVLEDIKDAEGRCDAAQENRKRNLGQALLSLERAVKLCADHPMVLKLRDEMSGVLEAKTAPPVTKEFVAAAKSSAPESALVEGHRLYTTRCAQCHDLEMLDSRSAVGWKDEVAGMAGRAKIDAAQQATIVQYIAAALSVVKAN